MAHLWGIDLGGTKIEGAILDSAAPDKPLCRLRVPTESEKGYAHIRSQIGRLVKMIHEESGFPLPKRIGMGTPGVIDPRTNRLKGSNTQCMNGQMLGPDLESEIGVSFVFANDANCFALAEATMGAGRGFPTVFGVILGTGVGGGIVVDGHVLNGCHGIAGEWGQIVLDPN
jgi:fructokinase